MIIKCLDEDNKILIKKIHNLEKEISELKNDKKEMAKKIKFLEDNYSSNIPQKKNDFNDGQFEVIENPWTKEIDPRKKKFDYILQKGDYLAQRDKGDILISMKSKHKFEIDKIYKLIYNINYIRGRFRIGFGDFGKCVSRLVEEDSVGLTNGGLYIDGEKISDIKLNINNKEVIFIINLKEKQKYFELFIDGKSYGKFNFKFDVIYGLAAFCYGSVEINTFRNS